MKSEDVERYWPSETNWLTRMASAPNGGWVRFEDYAALLDRAERAEAERDAAFAAGQEEMQDEAAIIAVDEGRFATARLIRALPIKPHP